MATTDLFSNTSSRLHLRFLTQTSRFYVRNVCPFHNDEIILTFWLRRGRVSRWPPENQQTAFAQVGHQITQACANHCGSVRRFTLVCPMARHPSRVEYRRVGRHRTSWCQSVVPDMAGTILELCKLHYQGSGPALLETCPGIDDRTMNKNWKTNIYMGFADTNVQLIEMFRRVERNCNAARCLDATHGIVC